MFHPEACDKHRSVLGHALFSIRDLGEETRCTFIWCTDDIKLGEPVSVLMHRVAIRRDLGRLSQQESIRACRALGMAAPNSVPLAN